MKTSDLTGAALDWAVAEADGLKTETWHTNAITVLYPGAPRFVPFMPSRDWRVGALVFEGRIANCPAHLTSDVGHELANQSGTFGLCWSMTKDGAVACSLRSNGEYDVSAIAKLYGGGGHKNAAGFETDMATLLRWMR